MRTRTVMALVTGCLSVLACSGVGDDVSSVFEDYSVPLTEPWTEQSLPVADGAVIYSDASVLTVLYDGGEVVTIGSGYRDAFVASGFAVGKEHADDDQMLVELTGDGSELALLVMSSGDDVTVSVTEQ